LFRGTLFATAAVHKPPLIVLPDGPVDGVTLTEGTALLPAYVAITHGLLLSHSCVIAQQDDERRETGLDYEHPYRLVAPVVGLEEVVQPETAAWDSLTGADKIVPFMYLPANPKTKTPMVALLHRAQLVLHDNLGSRVAQLSYTGTRWLQMKLCRFFAGSWLQHELFDPPMK
jgi:hypothetical protein